MKTERRHELQQNELVHLLRMVSPKIRPFLGYLGIFLVVVGVVWGSMNVLKSIQHRRSAIGWREFFSSLRDGDAAQLRAVTEQYRGTAVAAKALHTAGMLMLDQGTSKLLTDRAAALEELKLAEEDFRSAASLAKGDKNLLAQIHSGWAQVYESMNDLEQAREHYRKIVDLSTDEESASRASERLEFLGLKDTKAFANWFAKQRLDTPRSSPPGRSPSKPSVYDDLQSNDLMLPDADKLEKSEFGGMLPPDEGAATGESDEATDAEEPDSTEPNAAGTSKDGGDGETATPESDDSQSP